MNYISNMISFYHTYDKIGLVNYSQTVLLMNLFSLFQSNTNTLEQSQREAQRRDRYAYGVREVQRWTEAKRAWAEDGAQHIREINEKITELETRTGDRQVSEGLRSYLADVEETLEENMQAAEYRLSFYRNIVLMQGRV
jgi:TolA-binding protein